jgi:hypothetical protein
VSSGGQELFIAELAESDSGSYTCYTMSTNGSRQHRNINVVIKGSYYLMFQICIFVSSKVKQIVYYGLDFLLADLKK